MNLFTRAHAEVTRATAVRQCGRLPASRCTADIAGSGPTGRVPGPAAPPRADLPDPGAQAEPARSERRHA
ncbi:hypothetical protein AB0C34_29820 [Nocardia sp. NPDC049220]|uniref:hypothetical protein n=1 Tax=Nocardia sp. NPDC049220 TaxID=3155273 RepID=UPI0033D2397B